MSIDCKSFFIFVLRNFQFFLKRVMETKFPISYFGHVCPKLHSNCSGTLSSQLSENTAWSVVLNKEYGNFVSQHYFNSNKIYLNTSQMVQRSI